MILTWTLYGGTITNVEDVNSTLSLTFQMFGRKLLQVSLLRAFYFLKSSN